MQEVLHYIKIVHRNLIRGESIYTIGIKEDPLIVANTGEENIINNTATNSIANSATNSAFNSAPNSVTSSAFNSAPNSANNSADVRKAYFESKKKMSEVGSNPSSDCANEVLLYYKIKIKEEYFNEDKKKHIRKYSEDDKDNSSVEGRF